MFKGLIIVSLLILGFFAVRGCSERVSGKQRVFAPYDVDTVPLEAPLPKNKYRFAGEYREVYFTQPTAKELSTYRERLVFEGNRFAFRHYVGRFEEGPVYGYTVSQGVLLVNGRNWGFETDGKFLKCLHNGKIFAPAKDFEDKPNT